MIIAPCLQLKAQTEGADSVGIVKKTECGVERADSATRGTGLLSSIQNVGFDADGFIPKKNRHNDEAFWSRVPADCHIDWRRHRARPFADFCMDLAHFFNTYDTTYVERNRYNFRVMVTNTNFFQIYRIAGRTGDFGKRQLLTFVPDYAIKVGPRVGWRWFNVGYTMSVFPYTNRKTSELNFAAYNSRIGCDMNWQHSNGPFHLRRVRGIDGLPEYSVKGHDVEGISTNTVALNVYCVLNYRRFSYPAAYNACTVQLKSAGSWLIGATYDYQQFSFDPDEAERVIQDVYVQLHPGAKPPVLMDALRVREVNYHRIGISVGYAYNWVPAPGWLVSASLSPSLGFKKQVGADISKQMLADNFRNFHVDAIFRGGVTYNRQRWFVGASAVSYLYDYRHRYFDLNNNVTYLKAYVGVQFHKRRKFRLAADKTKW